jgi:hypothetical protein
MRLVEYSEALRDRTRNRMAGGRSLAERVEGVSGALR